MVHCCIMYDLTIETTFSSAHNLRGYEGACENLHGHNWRVTVTVSCAKLDSLGMVVDFKKLKEKTKKVIEGLDHKYLNELPPFAKENATAENISRYIFKEVSLSVNTPDMRVSRVRVWESENASAEYYE